MEKIILFIHGWSEHGDVFHKLMHEITKDYGHKYYMVDIAEFISMDDTVSFFDLVEAMQDVWLRKNLPTSAKKVDVITHSSGALILRSWLQKYYPNGGSPIEHVVMLAPPNFGSHLAHQGRSLLGRFIKGNNLHHPFEVGQELLFSLELGSDYTWQLALDDCFLGCPYFSENDVMLTILVGDHGYNGINSLINLDGSDGAVPIVSSSMSPALVNLSYDVNGVLVKNITHSSNNCNFLVLPGINHSTILDRHGELSSIVLDIIKEALTVSGDQFSQLQNKCNKLIRRGKSTTNYSAIIIKVTNQHHSAVLNYFVRFTIQQRSTVDINYFHDEIISFKHVYQRDSSYRFFYVNHDKILEYAKNKAISINLYAMPSFDHGNSAGYKSNDSRHKKSLVLTVEDVQSLLQPNKVLLVDWQITKEYKKNIFSVTESFSGVT